MLTNSTIEYLSKFKKVALAISGGKDSMCLLHFFINSKKHLPDFFVVNVNHQLRGQESNNDSQFVKQYCQAHNIQITCYSKDVNTFCKQNNYTIEQGARIVRRQIFQALIDQGLADRVVTAHHQDDQTESILMHIFRGCGINGLCGMQLDDGALVRPFLDIDQTSINNYILDNKVEYVEDSSNDSTKFSRNKLRKDILPQINSLYGNINSSISRLSKIATQIKDYTNNNLPKLIVKNNCVKIDISLLKNCDFMSAEIVAQAVEKLTCRTDLTYDHIYKVFDLCNSDNSKKVNLPYSIIASKEYDHIVFSISQKQEISPIAFGIGEFIIGNWTIAVSHNDNGGLRCDYDQIKHCIFRTRQVGDRIEKFGGGSKSLGDYLTDKKVALRLRDSLIVVADNKQIYAVPPIDISEKCKVTASTKQIVYILALLNQSN